MKISWKQVLALSWSFTWRILAFGFPFVIAIGFLAYPLACVLGAPESDHAIAFIAGQILWLFTSVFALRFALLRHADLFVATSRRLTWAETLSVWWSFLWRMAVYGMLIGLLLGLFVSVFVGRPSEHPGYPVAAILVGIIPVELLALRSAISKQKFSTSYLSTNSNFPNHSAEPPPGAVH